MNKKQYIIPECVMLLMEPALHIAAGSVPVDNTNTIDNDNVSGGSFELGSKESDDESWELWEE